MHNTRKYKLSGYKIKSEDMEEFIKKEKHIVFKYANVDFYIVGSIILKALSDDISTTDMTDVDIAIHIENIDDENVTFDNAIKLFAKKILKTEYHELNILKKTENRYVIMHKCIKLDIFRIHDSINNIVRKFHLPPCRSVFDLDRLHGYASFYHSIYKSTIPYLHISTFHSQKKTIKQILNKYRNYGFRFLVKKEDKIKFFD